MNAAVRFLSGALLFGAGLFVGAVVLRGGADGAAGGDGAARAAQDRGDARDLDEALAKIARLEAQVQALQRRRPEPGDAAGSASAGAGSGSGAVANSGAPASTGGVSAGSIPVEPAARSARVRELTAAIEDVFSAGDGREALELMMSLADIVPEGRGPAMSLAVRINDDVRGEKTLGLDGFGFYGALGDPGARDLMLWGLENDSPAGFRVLAAYSLPWVVTHDAAIAALSKAVQRERDTTVQIAIVGNLANMNDPNAQAALVAILSDEKSDGALRAIVAGTMSSTKSAAVVTLLGTLAKADPDERVRAAAHAALVARDPPADGYLVSLVLPAASAAAAGLRPGDVVTSYDGQPIRSAEDLRAATEGASGRDGIAIVVHRAAGETSLQIRGGPLGVQGRAVRRK
jgi:hypothetical protein